MRLLQPHERQPVHRADVHAGAGDLGERRRHHQAAAAAFELPTELAHPDRPEAARGDGHDVGVGAGGLLGGGEHAAEHRDAGRDLTVHLGVLDTDPDHLQPGILRALGDRQQVPDRFGRADGQDPIHPAILRPAPGDHRAHDRAAEEQQDDADRDDTEHEAPCDLQFECIADDREHTHRQRAGAQDPFGLLRAGGEVADLVPAAVLQRDEPAGGHGKAQPEVVQHVPRLLAVDEAEPHDVAEHGRHRDRAQIGDEQQQAVVHHPAGLARQAGIGPGGATLQALDHCLDSVGLWPCLRHNPASPDRDLDGLVFPLGIQFTPRADRTPPPFGGRSPAHPHAVHTRRIRRDACESITRVLRVG